MTLPFKFISQTETGVPGWGEERDGETEKPSPCISAPPCQHPLVLTA